MISEHTNENIENLIPRRPIVTQNLSVPNLASQKMSAASKVLRQPKNSEMAYFGDTTKEHLLQYQKKEKILLDENVEDIMKKFSSNILEELTKAVDKILKAVNSCVEKNQQLRFEEANELKQGSTPKKVKLSKEKPRKKVKRVNSPEALHQSLGGSSEDPAAKVELTNKSKTKSLEKLTAADLKVVVRSKKTKTRITIMNAPESKKSIKKEEIVPVVNQPVIRKRTRKASAKKLIEKKPGIKREEK